VKENHPLRVSGILCVFCNCQGSPLTALPIGHLVHQRDPFAQLAGIGGETADDAGPAHDLAVEPSDEVGRVDLATVDLGEEHEGEFVLASVLKALSVLAQAMC